jgi:hypothetical protein
MAGKQDRARQAEGFCWYKVKVVKKWRGEAGRKEGSVTWERLKCHACARRFVSRQGWPDEAVVAVRTFPERSRRV